jgi:hypothetical protein
MPKWNSCTSSCYYIEGYTGYSGSGGTGPTGYTGPPGESTGLYPSDYIVFAGLTTNQTIISDPSNNIKLQLTAEIDPRGWWDDSNYLFRPSIAGYYDITAQVFWNNGGDTTSNQFNIQLTDSSNVQVAINQQLANKSAIGQCLIINTLKYFDGISSSVNLSVYNGTNSSIDINGDIFANRI